MNNHFCNKNRLIGFPVLWLIWIAFLLVNCSNEEIQEQLPQTKYVYQKPIQLQDGWLVSDLMTEGLDSIPLKILMDSIEEDVFGVLQSLLIIKNNKLVLEEYFNGWDQNELHPMFSITKSISSAVVGIAIDKGFITDEEKTISQLLSGFDHVEWTDLKKSIRLKNYLTMTAGYEWDEYGTPYDNPSNPHYQMMASDDWIRFILELPMEHIPGEKFNYNTGTSNLFSVIVQEVTGERFDEFAHRHLFSKLGIDNISWFYLAGDYPATGGTYGGVRLRSRDMAKFGSLFMNEGIWQNERLISHHWIHTSLSPHINVTQTGSFTYGYQWWRNEGVKVYSEDQIQVPFGVGFGGQYIILVKEFDLLIIITSHYNQSARVFLIFEMIEKYILQAIQ